MKKLYSLFLITLLVVNAFGQTISNTVPMNSGRQGHQSQLLNTGKVLAFGGAQIGLTSYEVLNSSELYDPIAKKWTKVGSMNSKRKSFTSVLLNNGKVLSMGGVDESDVLNSCEVFDPSTNTWSEVREMQVARYGHGAIKLIDGRVLVAGGVQDTRADLYDPYTDTWTSTAKMNLIHGVGMTLTYLPNGGVLAVGGQDAPTRAEIWNGSSWTLLSSVMTNQHYYHSVVVIDNNTCLIAGSQSFIGNDQISAEIYNISTQKFTSTGKLLTPVSFAPMVLMDNGKVLLYGMGDSFSSSNTKCLQVYDLATESWSSKSYSIMGGNAAIMNILNNGTILLAGGTSIDSENSLNNCYLVTQDGFSSCSPPSLLGTGYGSTGCINETQYITLSNLETNVTYKAFIGGYEVASSVTGVTNKVVPVFSLSAGDNVIKIKAFKQGCPAFVQEDTVVVRAKIAQIPAPQITVFGKTIFCDGDSVVLSAPGGMPEYRWGNSSKTQKITVKSTGGYVVRVKDSISGCFTSYSQTIYTEIATKNSINAGIDESVCANAVPKGLTGFVPVYGTWSGPGISENGTFDPSGLPVGSVTLSYEYCTFKDTKVVTVLALPKAEDFILDVPFDNVCLNSTVYIYVKNTQGNSKYEIWNKSSLLYSQISSATGSTLAFTIPKLTDNTIFNIKGIAYNKCAADTISKYRTININVNPYLPVGTKQPFVCKRGNALIYIAKSETAVSYQLLKDNTLIGTAQYGNGDTLFLNTGALMASTTFKIRGINVAKSCTTALIQSVYIAVDGPTASFCVNTQNPEVGEILTITNYSDNVGGSYIWSLGKNASIDSTSEKSPPAIKYSKTNNTRIGLYCFMPNGCKDSSFRLVNVIPYRDIQACDYSLASSESLGAEVYGVAYDSVGNSYMLYQSGMSFYSAIDLNYGTNGDSANFYKGPENPAAAKYILVKYNAKGIVQWSIPIRMDSKRFIDLAADYEGGVYFGYHDGSRAVVQKFNRDGVFQWWGQRNDQSGVIDKLSVMVDKQLNVYLASQSGTAKFDKNGVKIWDSYGATEYRLDSKGRLWGMWGLLPCVSRYGSSQYSEFDSPIPQATDETHIYMHRFIIDNDDNMYVSGTFTGTFTFANQTISHIYNSGDVHNAIFIAKFDRNGKQLWIKKIDSDVSQAWLSGMVLRKGQIILFAGVGKGGIVHSNIDQLTFTETGRFLLLTDTTATGKYTLVKVYESIAIRTVATDDALDYCPATDRLMISVPFDTEAVLGQYFQPSKNSFIDANIVVMRGEIDCLLGNTTNPTLLNTSLYRDECVIYPNPCNEYIEVEIPEVLSGANYTIQSVDGKIVQQGTCMASQKVYLNELNSGIYLIKVKYEDGIRIKQFVKQ